MKWIIALTMCACLLGAGVAPAQAEVKIGIVNIQDVLEKSEPGQSVMAEFQGKADEVKKELEKRKNELEKLRGEMEKQSLVLSQDAKQDKELEFKRKVRDYQDYVQVTQRNLQVENDKLSKPIMETLGEVLKDFGKKNKFTMIVDVKTPGVVYTDEANDVTKQVILELNKAWREHKKK
ncbi:OmpH family outer membrane protein [Desulfocurvibacter africanus]|uniref:Outer membrane chaperone Skp (OmpH) n=1 Tax=Desulfocurvibacter africanus subsp. africanus str. Walvis Bay TaxID=690850 RepID=F3Z0Z5_DESAF|nr:OmpH family outer membrane protein [Desulfocurvibacter africanus]EGJ51073.1 outer membrane chaperone Skp (OmpH) [Desulfocurvibacter africanus subsp. africanus str. Walvis Bay]